ncbi:hypothetical protein MSTO_00260 [Mycobacterium stomatepiae]|uniref:Uncharacterized protein n=1 Tax=Mycobacterium stomatepiae TaxID=470076 RepID=A0A7I7Q108_9MYCO|nr:hypothetical protein MSTO_00260 [Mycobacterium stomatepiae]
MVDDWCVRARAGEALVITSHHPKDESGQPPADSDGISIWGHLPEGPTIVDRLAQFKTGAASLLHREDVVSALAGAGIPD